MFIDFYPKEVGMRITAVILCLLFNVFYSSTSQAVAILQYHHVSDTTPTSTSISVEQFTRHMNYLKQQEFKVLPLTDIITGLKAGKTFDQKTVAITFDDGYLNVLTNADPILKALEFPYSLFVSPADIAQNRVNMLNWEQLKTMSQSGVLILNHSMSHQHLNRQLEAETAEQWKARVSDDITQAQAEIDNQLGEQPKYLAYPYGEYNHELLKLVDTLGFIGLGQHSGAVSPKSNFAALPRFPASGRYANLKTLKIKLQTMVMPVTKITNDNPQLDQHTKGNPKRPELVMTLNLSDIYKPTIACYILGEKVEPIWINNSSFSIASNVNLPAGRSRYNCTAQSRKKSGYYWFSQPWINRNNDGSWPQG